ncbi:SGNH/GDSL hydrolase family protein [Micromonospora echinofusca]|uniref:SGNH/GDSL hydrolase family protein n=1 Tax=Micromonospora echinofusca TaxID=47858 RepID=UPI00341789C2
MHRREAHPDGMAFRRPTRRWLATTTAVLLAAGGLSAVGAATANAEPTPDPARSAATDGAVDRAPEPAPEIASVAVKNRDEVLSKRWRTSADLAWTTAGDSRGFHLLVAEARTGYTWRTVATLVEPTIESDQWIGNACLTGSGKRAVVVYQPRHFTNRSHLFDRGAFSAVVDIASGRVTKLGLNVSIAYHNPGCGNGETATLSQGGATDLGQTRLHLIDTARGKVLRRQQLTGQVTSAIPYGENIAAAEGGRVFALDRKGSRRTLATTRGVGAYLRADRDGGITWLEAADDRTTLVRRVASGKVRELARGPLTELGLARGSGGRVFVTGQPTKTGAFPAAVERVAVPVSAELSTLGQLAIRRAPATRGTAAAVPPTGEASGLPVNLRADVPATGKQVDFRVALGARANDLADTGRRNDPQLSSVRRAGGVGTQAVGSPTDPVDADRYCSVPRNDVRTQVEQPHWEQVEWAANMAVQGALTTQRPTNWRQSGLPAWSPQGMLPPIPLAGGGRVPAQVMLGILAQESNLWQASWHTLEGVAGNALIGNYYGIEDEQGWNINWADADCGYGVGQVTDGMRLAGKGKPGEVIRPANEQRAIAVDYATNIAAGLRILQEKWNQTYNLGIRMNDADPANPENWWAAIWAYNTGLNPQAITGGTGCSPGPSCTDDRGNWGLGWSQNLANPEYPFTRTPFLDGNTGTGSPGDAATPNRWSYPEKVLGWAAYPIVKYDFRTPNEYHAGFRQAWWTSPIYRSQSIKPPLSTFCTSANNCSVTVTSSSCGYSDYHCWWHWPVDWKNACATACGYENLRFSPGSPEPARGTHYPPRCTTDGLPAGALVVDDQPASVGVVRSDLCGTPVTNSGSFNLRFNGNAAGLYPSKVDFHQNGSGLNGHFWFAHEQNAGTDMVDRLGVTGTWQLGRSLNQWARVFVHMPSHGAHSQQAHYTVDRGANITSQRYKTRTLGQRQGTNRWVPLGVFQFNGVPQISMSNITRNSNVGVDNVAWDAVAFVPLAAKPRNFVVALGESFSSGEGAATDASVDYYHDSNHDGGGKLDYRNGCHRSRHAWSRQAWLKDDLQQRSIGTRADTYDPTMDYHLLACSGARTHNLLPSGRNPISGQEVRDPTTNAPFATAWGAEARQHRREVSQLDKGFLDENTTLVTLSIGGNDMEWAAALQNCILLPIPCQESDIDGHRAADYLPQLMQGEGRTSVITVLRAVRTMAPNAQVVLMGYPQLLSNDANCVEWLGYGISDSEASWMNQMAIELADALRQVAVAANAAGGRVRFADPIVNGDFDGQGVCGVPETIHGVVAAKTAGEDHSHETNPSAQSFHPKISGATNYARTLNREFRNLGL